jgi:hypothetical protein
MLTELQTRQEHDETVEQANLVWLEDLREVCGGLFWSGIERHVSYLIGKDTHDNSKFFVELLNF